MDAISFCKCNLINAIFAKAFMECSYFGICNMTRCNMDGAHLLASYIEECNWTDAFVRGTNLLEITAKKVTVTGLNMDERTSVNDADFDEFDWSSIKNHASCLVNDYYQAIISLMEYYDRHGQGRTMALPIIGAGFSRLNMTEQVLLETLVSTIKMLQGNMRGNIRIVVHSVKKNRVSITNLR